MGFSAGVCCLAGDQWHLDLETEAGTVVVSRGERFAEGQTPAIGSWLLTFCSVGISLSSDLVLFPCVDLQNKRRPQAALERGNLLGA